MSPGPFYIFLEQLTQLCTFLRHIWNKFGQVGYNTQKPLQVFTISWAWHSVDCFYFQGVWFHSVGAQHMTHITHFENGTRKWHFSLLSLRLHSRQRAKMCRRRASCCSISSPHTTRSSTMTSAPSMS